jgi:hypothetical protein
MVKLCSTCRVEKLRGDFYAHGAKCKDCTKLRVKQHRIANLEAVRAYDRKRALLPHRIENATRVTREWRRKHKDRQAAHNKAARTPIKKVSACEGCGRAVRLEKHHPDYTRPLLIVWLCKPCHVIADKVRRIAERASA